MPINNKIEKKIFNCECCNFTTYMRNNYNRHLYTKKHQDNENKIKYNYESYEDIMNKIFSTTSIEDLKSDELRQQLVSNTSLQREIRRCEIRRKEIRRKEIRLKNTGSVSVQT